MTAFRVVVFLYLLGWQCEDAFRVQSRRGRGKVKRFQGKFTNIDTKHSLKMEEGKFTNIDAKHSLKMAEASHQDKFTKIDTEHSLNMAEASHEVTNPSGNRSNGSFEVARIVSAVASGSLGVSGSKVKNESSITQLSPSRVLDSELQSETALREFASPSKGHPFDLAFVQIVRRASDWLKQGKYTEKMGSVFMTHLETEANEEEKANKKVTLDVPLRYQDASSLCRVRGQEHFLHAADIMKRRLKRLYSNPAELCDIAGRTDHDVWLWHATKRSAYQKILHEGSMRPGKAHGSMPQGIYMGSLPEHAIRKAQYAFGVENGKIQVNDQDVVFAAPVRLGEVFRVGQKSLTREVFPDSDYSLFIEFVEKGNSSWKESNEEGKSPWKELNGAEWIIGHPGQIDVLQSIPFVWATEGVVSVLPKLVERARLETYYKEFEEKYLRISPFLTDAKQAKEMAKRLKQIHKQGLHDANYTK